MIQIHDIVVDHHNGCDDVLDIYGCHPGHASYQTEVCQTAEQHDDHAQVTIQQVIPVHHKHFKTGRITGELKLL